MTLPGDDTSSTPAARRRTTPLASQSRSLIRGNSDLAEQLRAGAIAAAFAELSAG
jgi:hypothetical protein